MNHTPAPWTVDESDVFGIDCVGVWSDRDEWVAHVETWSGDKDTASVARANAHLIAAAPEMYEALIAILQDYEERFTLPYTKVALWPHMSKVMGMGRDAIVKAEGR